MTIKALIFDMGGVVVFYDNHIAARKMSKLIRVSAKKIFDIIDSPHGKFTITYESTNSKDYWKIAAKKLGVEKIPEKIFDKLWNQVFWPNKPMLKLIRKLRKTYKIALLSNTGKLHENYLSKKYKFQNLFHTKIYSFKIKARKPGRKIYQTALKRLKVRPSEAIFIDDRLKNIRGAEKLGISTIYFKNNKQFLRELKRLGIK